MAAPVILRLGRGAACMLGAIGLGLFALGYRAGRLSVSRGAEALSGAKPLSASEPGGIHAVAKAPATTAADDAGDVLAVRQRLTRLLQAPLTPQAEDELRSSIEALAGLDATAALQLATAASTPRLRELLRNAALRGWAAQDPVAAADWLFSHVRAEERRSAVEMLMSGAAARPQEAMAAASRLLALDPLRASENGETVVSVLSRAGRFEMAGRFAAQGPAEYRAAWLATAYGQWAQYQPAEALSAANRLDDPSVRDAALQGVITGWSTSDPAALTACAQQMPSGELRAAALRDGLRQWVSLDPVAASKWMEQFDPVPDLDTGAAALATASVLVERRPEVAATWAESIVDPELRANTLLDFIRQWSAHDPAGARRYAATSPALRAETRELLLATLSTPP
jgi:hypothetical protein